MTFPNRDTETISPKAQVFMRGFVEFLETQPSVAKLRECQSAGVEAITELEGTLSLPYLSKLTQKLESLGVVEKKRVGKSFQVTKGLGFPEFVAYLKTSSFGLSLEATISDQEVADRSNMLDFLRKHPAVRIESVNPLPKAGYRVLIDKFREGKLDMIFVDADCSAYLYDDEDPIETFH